MAFALGCGGAAVLAAAHQGGLMNPQARSCLLFVTGMLLAIQAGAAGLRYESERLGLVFQHPQNFLVGQPMEDHASRRMAEAMAKRGKEFIPPVEESLIERKFAAGQDLNALRLDSPQIHLSRHRGSDAEFDRKLLMKEQLRRKMGGWEVYVLPGAPGPYGDMAFYYLISLKDGSVLEIVAPRSDLEGKPTHYDRVIHRLIESLEVVKADR